MGGPEPLDQPSRAHTSRVVSLGAQTRALSHRVSQSRFVAELLKTIAVAGGVLLGLFIGVVVAIPIFAIGVALEALLVKAPNEMQSVVYLGSALFCSLAAIIAGAIWGGIRVARHYPARAPQVERTREAFVLSTSNESVACPNCGAERRERFCGVCGQNDRDYRRLFVTLSNVIGEIFEADSRLWRTLHALFLRPGFLAAEFARNRRANYVSPFRLYLFASLIYFLVVSLVITPSATTPTAEGTPDSDVPNEVSLYSDPLVFGAYLEYLPLSVIFALPVYATMLQFLFIGRRVYAESFVFVLHLQTIGFFIFLLFMPWMEDIDAFWWQHWAFVVPLGAYLFLALKRFYGAGVFRTLGGWFIAMTLYVLFMVLVILGSQIAAELSLGNDLSRVFTTDP